MKQKLCSLLFAILTVAVTWNWWFGYNGKIVFQTNVPEKQEITLTYKHDGDDTPVNVKTKADKSGKLTFNVNGRTINRFKIHVKEDVAIDSVKFYGAKAQNIAVAENRDFAQRGLINDWHMDWWNLIVFAALGWYIGWFLVYCLNNGVPQDDPKLPKILNIEFLRVFFTLGIVWHHFVGSLGIWNKGYLGVEFFFILSGFLLVLTFRPERTVGDFIMNKWIRFMPLIVFGGILICLFKSRLDWTLFIKGLFFIPSDPKLSVFYNGSTWYLVVLFWVSLFYFYMLKFFKKETVNMLIAVLTVLTLVFVGTGDESPNVILNMRLMRGLSCMGLGYFLIYIYQNLKDKKIVNKAIYSLVELVVLLFAMFNIFYKPLFSGNIVSYLAFVLVVLMFLLNKGVFSKFFEKPVFAKMARYCLAIYLTHEVVTSYIFPIYLERYNELFLARPIIPITAVLTAAILLGVVAHHVIELPATRALKKIIK